MARSNSKSVPDPSAPKNDLSEAELRFIDEFLVDRDPMAAGQRAGVSRLNLKRKVSQWMGDPRIVRAIQLKTDASNIDEMISPQRIMAGFIDVAFNRDAPPAARNTALRELASLKKMYGEDDKDNKNSGVIMIPVAGNLQQWGELAAAAQQKLKEDVRG